MVVAVTRRAVIAGAAAIVAGAGVDLAVTHRRGLLARVGLESSPDRTVPDAHVPLISGSFASVHMHGTVGWAIAAPSGPVDGVVVCLHGYHEDHRFAFDQIHLQDFVATAGARLAIAAVDGGADSYWHPRADGTDALAMLLDEFVPLVDSRVDTRNRALLGWSMGGYGALLAAETAPARFQAVAAASPALWTSPTATAAGAFDGPDDYHRHDVFAGVAALQPLTVRVDCGTGDPFHDADRAFVARLQPSAQTSFGPGLHDAAYWRSVAPAQVRTIATALTGR